MEYYFETDDKLDRKRYAEFLKSMLENCDKYRREDSDGAYVIAIDSPWGTGKTRFAKMLRNYLEGRNPQIVEGKADKSVIPKPNDNRKFNVIYYNSWETDYWGDALEPLIHNVLNSELFELIRADSDCDDVTNKLWRATKGVLKAVGLGFARNIIGDAAAEVIKGTIDEINTNDPDPLAAYTESIKMYNQFKEALTQTIEQTGRKLVIIVDELDRCRPTFAIHTLELAKHLFSVEGLIFVFALDIKQLSSSVKTVYGQDMDATGYLCRFFEYTSQLPLPDKRRIIEEKIVNLENKGLFSLTMPLNTHNKTSFEITAFILDIAQKDNLSIRELLTLLNHFEIMIVTFLRGYYSEIAFQLYFFLLYLKLKHLDMYNKILCNNKFDGDWREFLVNQLGTIIDERVIMQKLIFLNKKDKIKDIEFKVTENNSDYTSSGYGMKIKSVQKVNYHGSERITIKFINRGTNIPQDSSTNIEFYECLDQILFYSDIINWEQIKDMTLPEYYHQRLEMFNFALPADEPETQS